MPISRVQDIMKNCKLHLSAPALWVGIGCQKTTSRQLIEKAIEKIWREFQLDDQAIAGFATLESKASEIALVELCRLHNLPLRTFSREILNTVLVPNPAPIVEQKVGTSSVAEAAAILAASPAVRLLVPKQIFRLPEQLGTVTVAVAQSAQLQGSAGRLVEVYGVFSTIK